MKYRPKQCPTCIYRAETRFVEDNTPGEDVCGWDNAHFKGVSKISCIRYVPEPFRLSKAKSADLPEEKR